MTKEDVFSSKAGLENNANYAKACIKQHIEAKLQESQNYRKDKKKIAEEIDNLVEGVYNSLVSYHEVNTVGNAAIKAINKLIPLRQSDTKKFTQLDIKADSIFNSYSKELESIFKLRHNDAKPDEVGKCIEEIKSTEIARIRETNLKLDAMNKFVDAFTASLTEEFANRIKVGAKKTEDAEQSKSVSTAPTILSAEHVSIFKQNIIEAIKKSRLYDQLEGASRKDIETLHLDIIGKQTGLEKLVVNLIMDGLNFYKAQNYNLQSEGGKQVAEQYDKKNLPATVDYAAGKDWLDFFKKLCELAGKICANAFTGQANENKKLISDFHDNTRSLVLNPERLKKDTQKVAQEIAQKVIPSADRLEFGKDSLTNKWTVKVKQEQHQEGQGQKR